MTETEQYTDGTDHHLSEALAHLREARATGFGDDHVAESVDNAITETIVARQRSRLVQPGTNRPEENNE